MIFAMLPRTVATIPELEQRTLISQVPGITGWNFTRRPISIGKGVSWRETLRENAMASRIKQPSSVSRTPGKDSLVCMIRRRKSSSFWKCVPTFDICFIVINTCGGSNTDLSEPKRFWHSRRMSLGGWMTHVYWYLSILKTPAYIISRYQQHVIPCTYFAYPLEAG